MSIERTVDCNTPTSSINTASPAWWPKLSLIAFEAVDVDQQQRNGLTVPDASVEFAGDDPLEMRPVPDSR